MNSKTSILLVLSICCVAVLALPVEHYFNQSNGLPTFDEMYGYYRHWHGKHGGKDTPDTADRFKIFSDRALKIIRHNQNPDRTYNQTINFFTGRSLEEIKNRTLMTPQDCTLDSKPLKLSSGKAGTSDFFDWRDTHKVTPIKTQRKCGASYAFATVAAVETHWAIRTDATAVLSSEQHLVDCSTSFSNSGCAGGLPQRSFEYLKYTGGLTSEATYPFESIDRNKCRYADKNVYARVFNGSVNITAGDEQALFDVIGNFGPAAIGFDVTEDLFAYGGGVYTSNLCKNDTRIVNHVATVIGYGHDGPKNLDYWIVKNSWGPGWGEEGYFRIARGVNMCSLSNCASYPNMNYTSPIVSSSH